MTTGNVTRFHSLDALRGVAALSVVLWHWQHFFFEGHALPHDFKPTQMLPMFEALRIFYQDGWLAVDLFFSLSGFIFFWLYAGTINDRRVTGRKFFILRFSRLYPLHFLTLLTVAFGQIIYKSVEGHSFVYEYNDLRHFVLNLAMLPSVGLERGFSFNGPVWSLSVEVVLYAVFFCFCRFTKPRFTVLLVIAIAAIVLRNHFYYPIDKGIRSFFLGGCAFYLFRRISLQSHERTAALIIVPLTIALWVATIVSVYFGFSVVASLKSELHNTPILWRAIPVIDHLPPVFVEAILFPCTILSLALIEKVRGSFGARLSFLGDISYSSYLLHFPLQMLLALVAIGLGLGPNFFANPLTMILFFVVLIGVSQASYHLFEMPAQRKLRERLLRNAPSSHETGVVPV